MTAKPLPKTYQKALDLIQKHGSLYRYKGGYWARPGLPYDYFMETKFAEPWVGTRAVRALQDRGLLDIVDWRTAVIRKSERT